MIVLDLIYSLMDMGYRALDILPVMSSTLGNKELGDEILLSDFKKIECSVNANLEKIGTEKIIE